MWTSQYAAVIRRHSGEKNVREAQRHKDVKVGWKYQISFESNVCFFLISLNWRELNLLLGHKTHTFCLMFADKDKVEGFANDLPQFFFFFANYWKKSWQLAASCSHFANDVAADKPWVWMFSLTRCWAILKICIHILRHSGLLRCHFLSFYGFIYKQSSLRR